jgi:hypothetical protein
MPCPFVAASAGVKRDLGLASMETLPSARCGEARPPAAGRPARLLRIRMWQEMVAPDGMRSSPLGFRPKDMSAKPLEEADRYQASLDMAVYSGQGAFV